MSPQSYTKNHTQLRNAEVGKQSSPKEDHSKLIIFEK